MQNNATGLETRLGATGLETGLVEWQDNATGLAWCRTMQLV
jgi:hypothetical protein